MSKLTEALKKFDPRAAQQAVTRLDMRSGWENQVTGFGTSRDKTSYTNFRGYHVLLPQEASDLYHGDDVAARGVDLIPDEMLREGFTVDVGDQQRNAELKDALEALEARTKFADGMRWGRCFGGAALVIGADDGRPAAMPLVPELAESVRYLYCVDRRYLYPLTWYTEPGHPKLGQPETYLVTPSGGFVLSSNVFVIHESRLILFGGAKTASLEKQFAAGWDYSILQRIYEVIASLATGFKAVEVMMTDGNQAVFKMQGLAQLLAAADGGASGLQKRIAAIDLYRSAVRAIVVDAGDPDTKAGEESFERQSVSFEQIPNVLDKFMLRLAMAWGIPVTKLIGQSPAGLNATGESDIRNFYDDLKSKQSLDLAPKIRRLVRVMLATKAMRRTKAVQNIEIKFPPLWTEPASAQATRRNAIAQSDKTYIDAQVLTPEEVALARFRPDGFDQEIILSDEARAARETALETELDDMENPEDPTPPPGFTPPAPPVPSPPGQDDQIPPAEQRTDAYEDLLEQLGKHERAVIVGGPRTGKSTLAARAGERFKRTVRATDSLIGTYGKNADAWSRASAEVAGWFDQDGPWVVEGVAAPRALRKWMAQNPGKRLEIGVVSMRRQKVERSKGQAHMAKGVDKVWREILPELRKRGATVIEE